MTVTEMKVRGAILFAILKYAKEKWGLGGLNQIGQTIGMSPLEFHEGEWYNRAMGFKMLDWIAENNGVENVERCGASVAANMGLLSYITRFDNIAAILNKLQIDFPQIIDYCTFEVQIDDNAATVQMKDLIPNKYTCSFWTGFFTGLLEITNTTGKVTKTGCVLSEDPCCEYALNWE